MFRPYFSLSFTANTIFSSSNRGFTAIYLTYLHSINTDYTLAITSLSNLLHWIYIRPCISGTTVKKKKILRNICRKRLLEKKKRVFWKTVNRQWQAVRDHEMMDKQTAYIIRKWIEPHVWKATSVGQCLNMCIIRCCHPDAACVYSNVIRFLTGVC